MGQPIWLYMCQNYACRHAHPSGIVDAYKKKVLIVTIILNHQYTTSIS